MLPLQDDDPARDSGGAQQLLLPKLPEGAERLEEIGKKESRKTRKYKELSLTLLRRQNASGRAAGK